MQSRTHLVLAVGALLALVPLARAAERASLANGFEIQCDHHALVGGNVRLYLSKGESNYIELRPDEVTGFAQTPDPPGQTPQFRQPAQNTDVQLNPTDLREMMSEAGHDHNLDVDLLASVIKAESGGNARAVSRTGARGLMQLMPSTANDLGVKDSFRPNENVQGGSTYLDELLTHYHENLALALAAYNAGPAAVDRYHGIPPYHETRAYVARVIHEFNRRVLAREAQDRRGSTSKASLRSAQDQ